MTTTSASRHADHAKRLLRHYFARAFAGSRGLAVLDNDTCVELDEIVDSIISAAVEAARAK